MGIYNEDPNATVYVDGRKMEFEKGSCDILPWKTRYLVEVRSKRGIERRYVYPLAPESDSGVIVVKKTGVKFTVKNEPAK